MLYNTENHHGGDIYGRPVELDFSVSLNPLGPPDSVVREVKAAAERMDRYPDPFCRDLVRAIAAREGVPGEAVLCGNGAAELIYAWCTAARPRKALIPVPTFAEYGDALRAAGGAAEYWPLREKNGFRLEEDFLSLLGETDCDALFLCQPNNPTGRLIPPELLDRIAELCLARGIRLFADECFLDLTDAGPAWSLKRCLADMPGLFLLKAFTKTYAVAGLRLGYGLCGDGALLRAMGGAVQPWNVSLPAQAAGLAALEETDYMEKSRALIAREREWLAARLTERGMRVIPSEANFLLFRGAPSLGESLREMGILIRDCRNFRGLGPGWYRAGIRRREDGLRLLEAIDRIGRG